MTVSVVVISKDEPSLAGTLDALDASDLRPDEVLVVDASGGRLDHVRRTHPRVAWLDYVAPPGVRVTIPHQRNLGVRSAVGDIIVFTDCGCIPEPGWLRALVSPILHESESVCCGPTQAAGRSIYGRAAPRPAAGTGSTYARECPTINLAFRREAFERVDGFDESFAYGSDVDFSWRLTAAGVALRYVPDAVVVVSWGDDRRQARRSFAWGRARAHLYRKHPERIARLVLDDPVAVAYPLFLVGLPVAFRRRAYVALLALPLWRNRRKRPVRTVIDHLIQGAGVLVELARPRSGVAR